MEFKHSISILFSNMGYAMKILLWVVIALVITTAIGTAIIMPISDAISTKTDISDEITIIKDCVNKFAHQGNGVLDFIEELKDGIIGLVQALSTHTGAFVGLIFALLFLYALYCFLIGLSFYPTAYIVNNLMSCNMRFGFASAMAANFKNACKFSFCKVLISFPIDIIIAVVTVSICYGLMLCIDFFALPIALFIALMLYSARATLFAGWLPRLLFHPEEKMFTAFHRSLVAVKLNIKGIVKAFVITFFISYCAMTSFTLTTFGLINIVVPSLYYFVLRTIELVGYYKQNSLSFYVDATNVINTIEYGYRKDNQENEEEYGDINY